MRFMRRLAAAFGGTVVVFVLTGCGGLGVNIGSGPSRSSNVVNLVSVQPQSGINVPNVEFGHTLLMTAIAYYTYGSQNYVSATQGAVWTTCSTAACTAPAIAAPAIAKFVLMDAATNCNTPYAGTVSQTVCVLGTSPGTGFLKATVKGVSGISSMITVTL